MLTFDPPIQLWSDIFWNWVQGTDGYRCNNCNILIFNDTWKLGNPFLYIQFPNQPWLITFIFHHCLKREKQKPGYLWNIPVLTLHCNRRRYIKVEASLFYISLPTGNNCQINCTKYSPPQLLPITTGTQSGWKVEKLTGSALALLISRSDLSMWGHFLIVLNLRNPNLRSAHMNFTRQSALRHI